MKEQTQTFISGDVKWYKYLKSEFEVETLIFMLLFSNG